MQNKKRRQRLLAFLFTLILSCSIFSFTVFATDPNSQVGDITSTPGNETTASTSSQTQQTGDPSNPIVVEPSSSTPSTPPSSEPSSSSSDSSSNSDPNQSSTSSEDDWTSFPDGSSSENPDQSFPEESGSESSTDGEFSSDLEGDSNSSYSDASQNERPIYSDPGITTAPSTVASASLDERPATSFSSGELDELLSMAENSSEVSSVAGFLESSSQGSSSSFSSQSDGGISNIFLLGLTFIFLSLFGIGTFVYLQFFKKSNSMPNERSSQTLQKTGHRSNGVSESSDIYQDGFDYYEDNSAEPEDSYTDISTAGNNISDDTYVDINNAAQTKQNVDSSSIPSQNFGDTDTIDWNDFLNKRK